MGANLMGHNDSSMLAKVYQHLGNNPKHMLEQAGIESEVCLTYAVSRTIRPKPNSSLDGKGWGGVGVGVGIGGAQMRL